MSRSWLIVTVLAAAYALVNILLSMAVAVLWRSGAAERRPAAGAGRASRIVLLRAVPVLGSVFTTFAVVAPAFTSFEPLGRRGLPGPVLLALGSFAAVLVAASAVIAVRAALISFRIERTWRQRATALPIDPPAGVPAYTIDTPDPIVALVGVFSPKLVAARTVVEACSPAELASIVAHEHGHLRAHDNLKRWLMTCAPDVLRWTPVHGEMMTAWGDAAEDAADDAATGSGDRARLDLAALLVKIARLGSPPAVTAGVSPLVQVDGLERRVRRLVTTAPCSAAASRRTRLPAAVSVLLITALTTAVTPGVLEAVYEVTEAFVALGR